MAVYHVHAQVLQRSAGRNSIAAAAYRRAIALVDEQEQARFDYSRKKGVVHSELIIPPQSPSWLKNLLDTHATDPRGAIETLWNQVEAREQRLDAQLAREIEFSLPIELTLEQNEVLAREYLTTEFAARGMIVDWSIHWDEGNPHVHALLSMRELDDTGFGNKVREWNTRTCLKEWRAAWADHVNLHLYRHGHSIQVDHRSYAEQGIDLIPTIHRGKAVMQMEARGISTDIMAESRAIQLTNLEQLEQSPAPLLDKCERERSTFTHVDVISNLSGYANDRQRVSYTAEPVLPWGTFMTLSVEEAVTAVAQAPVLTPEDIARLLARIEHHDAVFTQATLARALHTHTDHADRFARALLELKASPALIPLGVGDDGRERYTTQRLFQVENKLQTHVEHLHARTHRLIKPTRVTRLLAQYETTHQKTLSPEQVTALHHLTGKSALACLVGRAGTGKSFLLDAAASIWQAQQNTVYGVALSGIAAAGLRRDTRMDAYTLASFHERLNRGLLTLDRRSVIVMDEAGMTDSPSMLALLEAIDRAQAKLVLVGDPDQLQPVGPGATFRAVLERVGFAELQTIYRQQVDWQRTASGDFAAGRTAEGLNAYEEKGRLHWAPTPDESLQNLVHDWSKITGELADRLVITHRNVDVHTLNTALRQVRIDRGDITAGHLATTAQGEYRLSEGDRVLFLKNHRALQVSNGQFGTVLTLQTDRQQRITHLTVQRDGIDTPVKIALADYNDFAQGYAATVHKTQGVTVKHSFVYITGWGWDRHLAYVALTRHQLDCHAYADRTTFANCLRFHQQLGRLRLKDSVLDFPLAFATRRGVDTRPLEPQLPRHLATRLRELRDRVIGRARPMDFTTLATTALRLPLNSLERDQAREDARIVAAWVDEDRCLKAAWIALKNELKTWGLNRLPASNHPAFTHLKESAVFNTYQKAWAARDQLSAVIWDDVHRYAPALQRASVSLTHLEQGALRHTARVRVADYQHALLQGQTVPRDRLAHAIAGDWKTHYPALQATDLDKCALREHATAHRRRQSFIEATPLERAAFRRVERYQALGAHMHQGLRHPKSSTHVQLPLLRAERQHLAYLIVQDEAFHAQALAFYDIKAPAISTDPTWTQQRFDRLRKQAHAYRVPLDHRHDTSPHAKVDHPARRTLFETLSTSEKQLIRLADRYVQAHERVMKHAKHLKVLQAAQKHPPAHTHKTPFESKQAIQTHLHRALGQRDALASRLQRQKQTVMFERKMEGLEPSPVDLTAALPLSWARVNQQAHAHTTRVEEVHHWQNQAQLHARDLNGCFTTLTSSTSNPSAQFDAQLSIDDWITALQKITTANTVYDTAFNEVGLTTPRRQAQHRAMEHVEYWIERMNAQQKHAAERASEQQQRIARAQRIHRETRPIEGTLAERYLREHRAIKGPLPPSLRYHPRLLHPENRCYYPALVASSTDMNGQLQAVQAIYLDPHTAQKARVSSPKLTYGVLAYGAVTLSEGSHKRHMAVAEGIETALSIAQARPDLTVYAALGSNNVARVPLHPDTQSVLICADHDGPGSASEQKMAQAAKQLSAQGVDVFHVMPTALKTDFNDLLQLEGIAAVKTRLKSAKRLSTRLEITTVCLSPESVKPVLPNKETSPAICVSTSTKIEDHLTHSTHEQEVALKALSVQYQLPVNLTPQPHTQYEVAGLVTFEGNPHTLLEHATHLSLIPYEKKHATLLHQTVRVLSHEHNFSLVDDTESHRDHAQSRTAHHLPSTALQQELTQLSTVHQTRVTLNPILNTPCTLVGALTLDGQRYTMLEQREQLALVAYEKGHANLLNQQVLVLSNQGEFLVKSLKTRERGPEKERGGRDMDR